ASVSRRLGIDRRDDAFRRLDDLAGVEAKILAKARRQDLPVAWRTSPAPPGRLMRGDGGDASWVLIRRDHVGRQVHELRVAGHGAQLRLASALEAEDVAEGLSAR